MKILKNKEYKKLLEKLELAEGLNSYQEDKIKALEKNNSHLENTRKIVSKNLQNEKEKVCKLRIDLEDTIGFLEQEKEANVELRKLITKFKTLCTKNNVDYSKLCKNRKDK